MDRQAPDLPTAATQIENAAARIVNPAVDTFYSLYPVLKEKHGPKGIEKCREDCFFHLEYLVAAMRAESPKQFTEYIRWVQVLLGARSASDNLQRMLELIGQQIRATHGDNVWEAARQILDPGLEALQTDTAEHVLYVMPPVNALARAFFGAILHGNRVLATRLVMDAKQAGMSLRDIYLRVFQPALYEVGRQWEIGQISVAQEHLATAITQSVLAVLYAEVPLPAVGDKSVIVACLKGNQHQIGPRMLADFLQMAGYNAFFLGADTPEDSLLAMIHDIRPTAIGLPASLARHVAPVHEMINIIRSEFASLQPTILVGGIAFNLVERLWQEVGADIWSADAGQAADLLAGS